MTLSSCHNFSIGPCVVFTVFIYVFLIVTHVRTDSDNTAYMLLVLTSPTTGDHP